MIKLPVRIYALFLFIFLILLVAADELLTEALNLSDGSMGETFIDIGTALLPVCLFGYLLIKDKKSQRKIKESEELYRSLVDISPQVIMVSQNGKCVFLNPAALELVEADRNSDLNGKSIYDFVSLEDQEQFKARIRQASQEPLKNFKVYKFLNFKRQFSSYIELKTVATHYRGKPAFLHVGRDVTDQVEKEKHIQHLVFHDSLTGLPNRRFFEKRINTALTKRQNRKKIGVMFIDLDNFKQVNDTAGHKTGDQLLKETTRRLSACIRKEDMLARLAGDEFVVLTSFTSEDEVVRMAERIIDLLNTPFTIENKEFTITSSIGIAFYPKDGEDSTVLLENADNAMYQAKQKGKNSYQIYQPEVAT